MHVCIRSLQRPLVNIATSAFVKLHNSPKPWLRAFSCYRPLRNITQSDKMEEELLPWYRTKEFCQVRPRQIFNDRYEVISKLGFGGSATVWLARDLSIGKSSSVDGASNTPAYTVLKVCVAETISSLCELDMQKKISNPGTRHPGRGYVQAMIDHFEFTTSVATHQCFVYEPMRESLDILQSRMKGRRIPIELIKMYLVCILQGLDFLHEDCGLLHADLRLENILMSFEHDSVLERYVQAQTAHPMLEIRKEGKSVYQSHNNFGPLKTDLGPIVPITADFGASAWTRNPTAHLWPIQPAIYRAPELWSMVEGLDHELFHTIATVGVYDAGAHLARMIALLGHPPPALLAQERVMREVNFGLGRPLMNDKGVLCETACKYFDGPHFDDKGIFLHPELIPSDLKIEDTITALEGKEKSDFLDFVVGSMLCWRLDDRKTARELLLHPWLKDTELPWITEYDEIEPSDGKMPASGSLS